MPRKAPAPRWPADRDWLAGYVESRCREQQDGWAGMLSLPRGLSLSADNRLQMRPAKEVESLRGRLVPLAGQHPEQPADDDGRQLRGDGGAPAGTAPAAALGSMVCALARACASTWMPNSSVWWWSGIIRSLAVRDAQRAVDRRGGSQPADIFR